MSQAGMTTPLSEHHCELLSVNYAVLLECINTEILLPHLVQNMVLTIPEVDRVREERGFMDKNACIISYLYRKPDTLFASFIRSLRQSGNDHVANVLETPLDTNFQTPACIEALPTDIATGSEMACAKACDKGYVDVRISVGVSPNTQPCSKLTHPGTPGMPASTNNTTFKKMFVQADPRGVTDSYQIFFPSSEINTDYDATSTGVAIDAKGKSTTKRDLSLTELVEIQDINALEYVDRKEIAELGKHRYILGKSNKSWPLVVNQTQGSKQRVSAVSPHNIDMMEVSEPEDHIQQAHCCLSYPSCRCPQTFEAQMLKTFRLANGRLQRALQSGKVEEMAYYESLMDKCCRWLREWKMQGIETSHVKEGSVILSFTSKSQEALDSLWKHWVTGRLANDLKEMFLPAFELQSPQSKISIIVQMCSHQYLRYWVKLGNEKHDLSVSSPLSTAAHRKGSTLMQDCNVNLENLAISPLDSQAETGHLKDIPGKSDDNHGLKELAHMTVDKKEGSPTILAENECIPDRSNKIKAERGLDTDKWKDDNRSSVSFGAHNVIHITLGSPPSAENKSMPANSPSAISTTTSTDSSCPERNSGTSCRDDIPAQFYPESQSGNELHQSRLPEPPPSYVAEEPLLLTEHDEKFSHTASHHHQEVLGAIPVKPRNEIRRRVPPVTGTTCQAEIHKMRNWAPFFLHSSYETDLSTYESLPDEDLVIFGNATSLLSTPKLPPRKKYTMPKENEYYLPLASSVTTRKTGAHEETLSWLPPPKLPPRKKPTMPEKTMGYLTPVNSETTQNIGGYEAVTADRQIQLATTYIDFHNDDVLKSSGLLKQLSKVLHRIPRTSRSGHMQRRIKLVDHRKPQSSLPEGEGVLLKSYKKLNVD